MRVLVSTHLRRYTGAPVVEAGGATLAELLADLDRRYPGLRFRIIDEQDRIREHIMIFVNRAQVRSLDIPLRNPDEVHIIGALSGGISPTTRTVRESASPRPGHPASRRHSTSARAVACPAPPATAGRSRSAWTD